MTSYDLSWLAKEPSVEARLSRLPPALLGLLRRAVSECSPVRVLVFGSRVRGDASASSDLDIAFEVPVHAQSQWSRFLVEEPDRFESLVTIDLVGLHQCSQSLRERILQEGISIYERNIRLPAVSPES